MEFFAITTKQDLPANTGYHDAKKKGQVLGITRASTIQEARKLLASKEAIVRIVILKQKQITVGFQDNLIVNEVGFKVLPSYEPEKLEILGVRFMFDKFVGAYMVTKDTEKQRTPVLAGDLKTKISELAFERELPTVTRPAFLVDKEQRHWYWRGYYVKNESGQIWWQVVNLDATSKNIGKIGWIKGGQTFSQNSFYFMRTAWDTNFNTVQNALIDAEKKVEKVVKPIIETVESVYETAKDAFEGAKNAIQIIPIVIGGVLIYKAFK